MCDRVVLGRLETERQTVEGFKAHLLDLLLCNVDICGDPRKATSASVNVGPPPVAIHEQQQLAAAQLQLLSRVTASSDRTPLLAP